MKWYVWYEKFMNFFFLFFGLRLDVSLKLSTKELMTVAMGGQR